MTDVDLLAADTRTPFVVRRRIARATNVDALVAAAQDLRPTVIALHDAHVDTVQLCAIITAFADALARRALELLTTGEDGLPPFRWVATGSLGRSEAVPSSDVDSALVWEGGDEHGDRLRALAGRVLDVLERCRFARDTNAASSDHPLFAQSAATWRGDLARWLDRPEDPRLIIVVSVLADARTVYERGVVGQAFEPLHRGRDHPEFLRRLRHVALTRRPPTGFLRDFVVEHSGEHRGQLDIKQGGLLPVVDLARYTALLTGATVTGTADRLTAASHEGVLTDEEARTLTQAHHLFLELRMDHQIRQLRTGRETTDFLDPAELSPLVRRYLREAFRAIARTQRTVSARASL